MLSEIIITLIVGGLNIIAWKKELLDLKGSIASFIIGWVSLYSGLMYFIAFLMFMTIGSIASKFRTKTKKEEGVIQVTRGLGNVLGNGLIPFLFILIEIYTQKHVYLAGFFGSIATANADTLASEIGMLSNKKPRLITNLKKVEPGTNGAITILGELSALGGAIIISIIPLFFLSNLAFIVALSSLLAGFIGSNFDSVIGAVAERKGVIGNNGTNFLAVLSGSVAGIIIFMILI